MAVVCRKRKLMDGHNSSINMPYSKKARLNDGSSYGTANSNNIVDQEHHALNEHRWPTHLSPNKTNRAYLTPQAIEFIGNANHNENVGNGFLDGMKWRNI